MNIGIGFRNKELSIFQHRRKRYLERPCQTRAAEKSAGGADVGVLFVITSLIGITSDVACVTAGFANEHLEGLAHTAYHTAAFQTLWTATGPSGPNGAMQLNRNHC